MLIYWLVIILTMFIILGLFIVVPEASNKLTIFIWSIPVFPVFGQVIGRVVNLSFTYVIFQVIIGLLMATTLFVIGKKLTCPSYAKILLSFWVLANFFSAILSVDPHESMVLFVIAIIFPLVLYIGIYNLVNTYTKLKKIIFSFLLAGLGHVVMSYLTIFAFGRERGLGSVHDINLISTSYVGNGFIASFLLVAVFFLFYLDRMKQTRTRQAIVYLILFLFIVEVFMTASRTALLLIPVIILVYLCTRKTNSRAKLVTAIMIIAMSTWFVLFDPGGTATMARARLVGYGQSITVARMVESAQDDGRFDIWANTLEIGRKQNLITGTGLGQLAKLDQKYTFGDAHSLWLNILVQQGLLSLIAFILLLISFYKRNIQWRLKYGDWNNIMLGSFWAVTLFCIYGTVTGASLINMGGYIGAISSFYLVFHLAIQDVLIKLNKENSSKVVITNSEMMI